MKIQERAERDGTESAHIRTVMDKGAYMTRLLLRRVADGARIRAGISGAHIEHQGQKCGVERPRSIEAVAVV